MRRAALWQAAELYEKSGSPTNAARAVCELREAVSRRRSIRRWMRGRSSPTWRRHRTTCKARAQWIDEIIRADKSAGAARTERSKYLAAKATLETAEPQVAMFNAIKLVAPLDKSLKIEARRDGEGADRLRPGARLRRRRSDDGSDVRHGASCIASSAPT